MLTTSSVSTQATTISGKLPVICGVYCITHIATGKRYVGQSIDCIRRMLEHARYNDYPIGNAIRLYGRDAFRFEILSIVSRQQLIRCEAGWISLLNTMHPNGFNQPGGSKPASSPRRRKRKAPHNVDIFS